MRIINAAQSAKIVLPTGGSPPENITFEASSPGKWGNSLSISIDYEINDPTVSILSPLQPPDTEHFNLIVYMNNIKVEGYLNVTMDKSKSRYLPNILKQRSELLIINAPISPVKRPIETVGIVPKPLTAGDDGSELGISDYNGKEINQSGLFALKQVDIFNILCIPPATRDGDTASEIYQNALKICNDKRAILIVDSPVSWGEINSSGAVNKAIKELGNIGITGDVARNAVIYFPRVMQKDPNRDNQIDTFVPCGIMAGIMAKTDTTRGVWKSPAGIDAGLQGVVGLQVKLSDSENGRLNPLGINCLRSFPVTGQVVWGARTLRGADMLADEYKYLAVRRTALFIEESLYRATQWVVFEPNDEPLWSQIRLNIGAFMHNLFRQGAFQGKTPKEAYLVKCDKETTTQNDINLGIVNILVAFAPLKPAEFVVIRIQQMIGQIDT